MHDLMCSFWRLRMTIELSIEQQADARKKEQEKKKLASRTWPIILSIYKLNQQSQRKKYINNR